MQPLKSNEYIEERKAMLGVFFQAAS